MFSGEEITLGITDFLIEFAVNTLGFAVKVGRGRLEGWRGDLDFYLFKCPVHKTLVLSYASGYSHLLKCPKCLEELGVKIPDNYPRLDSIKIRG